MCSCGCGLCTNTRKTALVYCPPRTAVNSSKWSGRTGLWRMFVLALLTHRRVHQWFLSQHCYSFCRCPLRFSSVDFSPPPQSATRELLHPSLLHSIIIRCKRPHVHKVIDAQKATVRMQKCVDVAPEVERILKWMGAVTGMDYNTGKFICLSKRKQLNTDGFLGDKVACRWRVNEWNQRMWVCF